MGAALKERKMKVTDLNLIAELNAVADDPDFPVSSEGELVLHGGGFFHRVIAAIKRFFKWS